MRKLYQKPPLTLEEQLAQLKTRGLIIHDLPAATLALPHIGYYRLSAYWYPYRQIDGHIVLDQFIVGASFEDAVTLYQFDRKLRLCIMDAIERIEVSLRTKITYQLAHQYGTYAHTDPSHFHDNFQHTAWLNKLEHETEKSKEEFIVHFQEKYIGFPRLPVWMATELLSLGSLSMLFRGLKIDDQRAIAKMYEIHHKRLADWLQVLTYIRNICAHHSRLWNKRLAIRPSTSGTEKECPPPSTPRNDKVFIILLIIRQLLRTSENDWKNAIEKFLSPIINQPHLRKAMGAPSDWTNHSLWK